ncbi:MAG: hypothetical protein KAV87_58695 [Desulfobacteraceae bacterium]|nr:hypothetical protein [Desulfobacteraceae bacterium]
MDYIKDNNNWYYEFNAGTGNTLRILPTQIGLLEMLYDLGYSGVVLKPCFSDWTGSFDYRNGVRRAFIFAKQTDLTKLRVTIEDALGGYSLMERREYNKSRLLKRRLSALIREFGNRLIGGRDHGKLP